jgi:hypothetical protein
LDAGGADADDGDLFVGEVVVLVPAGGVDEFALEVVQAFDVGPLPVATAC